MKTWILCAISFTLLTLAEPARILSITPSLIKSHYIDTRRILLELVKRGHEVVSISPFEEKDAPPNFTWIPIEVKSFFEAVPEMKGSMDKKVTFIPAQQRLWEFTNKYSKYIVSRPKLKDFIENDRSHFDLVIAEEFYQEVFYVFSHKYKVPLVLIYTFGNAHFINEYTGNSLELSYVPHEFLDMFGELSFFDRAKNLFYSTFDIVARKYSSLGYQNELAKDVFKDLNDVPHLGELERNASIIFINTHFSVSVVRPYLPNMIEIGGVHIEDLKPLSKEIADVMNKAYHGVVLFSLGSFMDLSLQPEEFTKQVLTALGKLKQTVILKWNTDVKMPLNFNNIYPLNWLPQNEILAHPNTVAFVTHGGLHSSLEAVHHGVPTICIPFFGDQPLNCMKSAKLGYGIHLSNITETGLYQSLLTLLSTPSYRETAKVLSSRFKDRPISPLNNAIYWVEYVIRHKGADFIKGPKRNLYWFQHLFVDVLLAFFVTVFIIFKLVSILLGLVFKKTKSQKVKRS